MHPWRPLIALVVFASIAAPAASVYKWTDADGVVHYSDQPEPGAEKVPLGTAPLHGTPQDQKPAARKPAKPPEQPKKPLVRLGYTEIAITAPTPEKTFVDEPIRVALTLSPDLQQGHSIVWYLNDSPLGETDTSFVIERLDRGAYSLYATITDAATGESVNSNTVGFYVRQPSVLAPQYPKK